MVPLALLSALSEPAAVLNLAELPVLQADRRQRLGDTVTLLRVRFPREHEFFEDGDVHRQLYLKGILRSIREVEEGTKVAEFRCQNEGCFQLFNTLESYEHHYNTLHRNACSICKRSFPSPRLLDIHILEWHDAFFQIMSEKDNMFLCLVEGCMEKFKTGRERKDHLIKVHLYPSDFRFDKPQKNKSKTKQDRNVAKALSMETDHMEEPAVESMDVVSSNASDESTENNIAADTTALSNLYSKCRVPRTICFGHGSVRGFKHAKKNK
ncbi:zinc finger 511 [Pelobates cultripes]|uniref:Zinc finger 511 n=1 Tax=Pelobates cultripes TaxID=61616 RepID=A0AAD1WQ73_PELCU|nr:zinc finger 511 [Pelobates cultripes]CAH2321643.1 zinc finger 511 [Pelobates cultripes]